MATLTFEVPETVAVALGNPVLRESDIAELMRDALNEIARELAWIADRVDAPDPIAIGAVVTRLTSCVDALEAVA
jgi:hypothetical protein